MISEKDLIRQVENRLVKLGYPRSAISQEMPTRSGRRIDLAVYEQEKCRIVIEVKVESNLSEEINPLELKFNPVVRQAQVHANEMAAPYFMVTNGKTDLWFTTDEVGRPQLLSGPVLPAAGTESKPSKVPREVLVRVLQQLMDVGRRGLHDMTQSADWAAVAIYAKLLHEDGNKSLMNDLLSSRPAYSSLSRLLPAEILPQDKLPKDYFREAFEILSRVSFRDASPIDMLIAFDATILNQMGREAIRLPRWLSDLLVRLAQIRRGNTVIDLFSNYGDGIAAALHANHQIQVTSISPTARGCLWAQIQQRILGFRGDGAVIGNTPPYDVRDTAGLPRPSHIILVPPFNVRLNSYNARSRFATIGGGEGVSEELYLELALDWVSPGGRIVALVPQGLLFAESRRRFREFLLKETHVRAVIGLGPVLSQTKMRTSILVIDKPGDGVSNNDVFMARIDEVDKTDAFSCQDITSVSQILTSFETFVRTGQVDFFTRAWFVSLEQLNADNLSVDHYDPLRPDRQAESGSAFAITPLRSVAEILRGSSLTLAKKADLLVIGPASIRPMVLDRFSLDRTTKRKLTSNPVTVQPGDVVVNAVGPYLGSAAVIDQDLAGVYVSRNVIVIRPRSPAVIPEFLAAALNSEQVKQQLMQMTTGSVISILTVRALQDIAIPLPNLETQKRVLNKIRKSFEELSRAKENMIKAEEAFTESVRMLSAEEGEQ